MPRKRNGSGEYPLPPGWDIGRDYDGKVFYIDHTTSQTTWIDPRDRFTKPQSFADCEGDELPFGWEEAYDPLVGVYYIDHNTQTNQIEDPRLQWREEKESMLKEYLVHAHEDLSTKENIYNVKQERYEIAREELSHLNSTLAAQMKASRTSLNSTSSTSSTKYNPDLLKADVNLAKNRVERLKQEVEQIRLEWQYQKEGVETLTHVKEKMAEEHTVYSVDEAQQIVRRVNDIRQVLYSGEREKQDLMKDLAKLYEEMSLAKMQLIGCSPHGSTLSIPREKFSTASQTDLSGEGAPTNQWGEMVRLRLEYDEAKKQVLKLQQHLARIENQMIPGQNESDQDRLLLIQEKEQLLRELRSKHKGKDEVQCRTRIEKLEQDLQQAMETSSKKITERLKLNQDKSLVLQQLAETTMLTTKLESQLKSLSYSTLSMSSGSSRGSLGSLSASSKGSLNSLMDIYVQPQSSVDVNLQDLYRRVENLLSGHSNIGAISPGPSISPIHEVPLAMGSVENLHHMSLAASTEGLVVHKPHLMAVEPTTLSPCSSQCSLSPPVSPYDCGPPPSYQQHLEFKQKKAATPNMNLDILEQSSTDTTSVTEPHSVMLQTEHHQIPGSGNVLAARRLLNTLDSSGTGDMSTNPPLSPISETSSGVCNNLSGGNTGSVSAAVSDESVAGDSGVYEASGRRSGELDDVFETSLECAQVQVTLRYDASGSTLEIGIEQVRNLSALAFAEISEVCIKASLLPTTEDCVSTFRTSSLKDLQCPKFNEVFRVVIAENRLASKTLQVNVWSVVGQTDAECLGSTQVSLANWDSKKSSTVWYNVLSFKFMEPGKHSPSNTGHTTLGTTQLLTASIEKLRRSSIGAEDKQVSTSSTSSSSRLRSSSLDSTACHKQNFAKEESSDESTIISSQTSTLTRQHDPADMDGHRDASPDEDEDDEEDDVEDVESHDDTLDPLDTSTNRETEASSAQQEKSISTCDKETNTETSPHRKGHMKRPGVEQNISSIRRSKTFSPTNRSHPDYICKLNRSDSDSSVKYRQGRGHFQRNASERRSVRLKRPILSASKSRTVSAAELRGLRTSIDLELDLQASKRRLTQQQDEIARLRDLKRKMEDARSKGDAQLPSWFHEESLWQNVLQGADKNQKKTYSQVEEKAEKYLQKVTKEVSRFRKKQSGNSEEDTFREKMSFFTTMSLRVPIIPAESDTDFDDSTLTSIESIESLQDCAHTGTAKGSLDTTEAAASTNVSTTNYESKSTHQQTNTT